MIEPLGKNLVFLLSTPRAGSTLLSAILGGHSKVLCPNEPWFLLMLATMYDQTLPVAAGFEYQFARAGLRDLSSREEFLEAARRFATGIYNDRLRATGKQIFVDKTPRYYHALPFIEELFPEAKKIWLKRNLLDSAASVKSTWTIGMDEIVGAKISAYSFDLTLGPANFAQSFDANSGFELRYEDLVQQPDQLVNDLCQFLGLEPEKGLAQYSSDSARVTQMADKMMGDKKVFQHGKPHQQSIGAWQKTLSNPEVQTFLDHTGEKIWARMGYKDAIDQLRQQGFRIPLEAEVAVRQEALTKVLRSCDFMRGERFFPPLTPEVKVKPHWWVRLGKKLGLNIDRSR